MCAATGVQTASHSVGMFIGSRFMIGFGLTFAGMSSYLHIGTSLFIYLVQPVQLLCWSLSSLIHYTVLN